MEGFRVHQLHFVCEVQSTVSLNEHKGSALRGALFYALRGSKDPRAAWAGFCAYKEAAGCYECPVQGRCPVVRLVSPLDEQAQYGREIPRPYIINPPLDQHETTYQPGDKITFDVLLVGEAADLFPYVVLAFDRLAYEGLGRRIDHGDGRSPRRGTARLVQIDAVHPLTGTTQPVLRPNSRTVEVPSLPIRHSDVLVAAERLPVRGEIRLRFLTPMRLIADGQLVRTPHFQPLLQRQLERIRSLVKAFSGEEVPFQIAELRDLARSVVLGEDRTEWLDLKGFSTRLGRPQVLGGLVGDAIYRAEDWTPFRPWLLWGTVLHAGKNAVKGDGWYTVVLSETVERGQS